MFPRFAILILALFIAGCSTAIEGAHEEVTMTTPGVTGARCQVENEYFRYIINPPRTFKLERTSQPYKISCLAPGNRLKMITIKPGFEETAFWNALNGVAPGFSVDAASGALFAYESNIVIDFRGSKPSPMPLPDYQIMFQENPLLKGMEEFRPGIPALQRDENTTISPMQPRAAESYNDFNPTSDNDKGAVSSVVKPDNKSVQHSGDVPGRASMPSKNSAGGANQAEALTRATNPRVFGTRNMYMKDGDQSGISQTAAKPTSGFVGGTSMSTMPGEPLPATGTPQSLISK